MFKFSGKDDFSISSFCNKMSLRSLLAFGISQKRKTNSESVFQPQWLKHFDWLEYDAETKHLFCRT